MSVTEEFEVDEDFPWAVWVEWPAPSDWTTRDAASRLVESVRLTGDTFPGLIPGFRIKNSGPVWTVDQPGVVDRIAGALTGRRTALDGELFADASLHLYPDAPDRLTINLDQLGAGHDYSGRLTVRFYRPTGSGPYLTRDPGAVAELTAKLATVWGARNAWVDFVHVRQEWNRWKEGFPVYGWATWLHPAFATVDPSGLEVDTGSTPDGGVLLTLRVDPAAMADPDATTGRATIEELVRRTVLADGRRLTDATGS